MADSENEKKKHVETSFELSLNYLCLLKHLGLWTTFVLNNLTSAYF